MSNTKTFHCTGKNLTVYYEDTNKHFVYPYETSPIESIQLYGNQFKGIQLQDVTVPQLVESDILSDYQNKLYKDAIHGLSYYSKKDIEKMSVRERTAIFRVNAKTQRVLNAWKQTIVNMEVDGFLKTLFPKSKIVDQILEKTKTNYDDKIISDFSFAELGISKKQIINKLIQEQVLPVRFYSL